MIESYWSFLLLVVIVSVFLSVLDYYAEAVAVAKAEAWRANRYGALATFASGLFLSVAWNHPLMLGVSEEEAAQVPEDHVLSGGVIFSFVLMLFGE